MTTPVHQPKALRIGLLIDSFTQPRWVQRAIEKILQSEIATIEIVLKVDDARKDERSLLYKVYDSIDRRLFAADALELVSIEEALKGTTVKHGFEQIEVRDLDVLINFGPTELNEKFASAAKHGVWFY